jgi:hypothetical protein
MSDLTNNEFQLVTLGAVKSDGSPDIANVLFQFPVPHQQMRIKQGVTIDAVKVKGRSGKVKQATGYDDSDIEITLHLVDIEDKSGVVTLSAQAQLQQIQRIFRDRSDPIGVTGSAVQQGRAVPTIYSISCPLTESCGIKTVLFDGFTTLEEEGQSSLLVTLTFVEFEPVPAISERRGKRKAGVNVNAMDELENRLKLYDTQEEMDLRREWEITTDVREAQGLDAELSFLEGLDAAAESEHQRAMLGGPKYIMSEKAREENMAKQKAIDALKADTSYTTAYAPPVAAKPLTAAEWAEKRKQATLAAQAKAEALGKKGPPPKPVIDYSQHEIL